MSAAETILSPEAVTGAHGSSLQRLVGRHSWALLYHGDCLDVLPSLPRVDAVIIDPPYGILKTADWSKTGKSREVRSDMNQSGKNWGKVDWDKRQNDLGIRLDVPCIVWGGNFYAASLPESGAWLCFNKRGDGKPSEMHFGDCELAWTNLGTNSVRMFSKMWHGKGRWAREPVIHPTQKPVSLMAWCIEQAKVPEGGTVLDSYMGSGTTGIACARLHRNFIGIERDAAHYKTACDRIAHELDGALL